MTDGVFDDIKGEPKRWLVTGAGGFIGSHLAARLVALGQSVRVLDDFSGGKEENIPDGAECLRGDIRDPDCCARACADVDIVLHQAAIGSVVKSIEEPALVDSVNVGGTKTLLGAAVQAGAGRFVYASSSAVYGDSGDGGVCVEDQPLLPKSPYAEGKRACEIFAARSGAENGICTVGLRYFNVYGPAQDPNGAYAAVIPRWIDAALEGRGIEIYGDGETVRDFCYIADVAEANLRAALAPPAIVGGQVYNIASGAATTLNALHARIAEILGKDDANPPVYHPFRAGDIRVSCASIEKAKRDLGYAPAHDLNAGLQKTIPWYRDRREGNA